MGSSQQGEFPSCRFSKLLPRGDGPFEVVKRINNNAYQIDLPGEYGVHTTFNVVDLCPFVVDDFDFTNRIDLGTNKTQEREDNMILHAPQQLDKLKTNLSLHGNDLLKR